MWNHSSLSPVQTYMDHLAAVKAIAWSPHQHGLLASGGGTADRCIRFWNTLTSQPLQCMDTGSQVCNLAWSKHANELVRVSTRRQYKINLLVKHPVSVCKCESLITMHIFYKNKLFFRLALMDTHRTKFWCGNTHLLPRLPNSRDTPTECCTLSVLIFLY